MDVTIAGRFGGPEIGSLLLARVVTLRGAIKAEFAKVSLPGLAVLDLGLFFSGDVSAYCEEGGVARVRYNRAKGQVTADICFATSELSTLTPTDVDDVLRHRIIECVEAIEPLLIKHEIPTNMGALCGAIDRAFAGTEEARDRRP